MLLSAVAVSGECETSFYILLLSLLMRSIFLNEARKQNNKYHPLPQNLDCYFVGISLTTCCIKTHRLLRFFPDQSFFFVFKSILLIYSYDKLHPFNMYSLMSFNRCAYL